MERDSAADEKHLIEIGAIGGQWHKERPEQTSLYSHVAVVEGLSLFFGVFVGKGLVKTKILCS